MKPATVFQNGRQGAEHMLKLAELLTNTRVRRMRADWAKNFKTLMYWRQREKIDRVDGTGAILILRESSNVTSKNFTDEYTSELLRAAHVTVVAALDRYCHELIVSRCIRSLGSGKACSAELRKIALPILDVHKAVMHARKPKSRPLNLVRASLQEFLYKRTFQSPNEIAQGLQIIGVGNLWTECGTQMNCTAHVITTRLDKIVTRRNKIVHEGDIIRHKRGGKVRYAKITPRQVADDVIWLGQLVAAIEAVVN
jgi:RiboL-PSP-HEPN